jgi:hypothetical protein
MDGAPRACAQRAVEKQHVRAVTYKIQTLGFARRDGIAIAKVTAMHSS